MREKVRERGSGVLGGNKNFRSNLVSIFVDNLNPKVEQNSLWGIFRPFGFVRHLHLSPKSRSRRSCFAFVRFTTKEEVVRFAELTNGMLIYGWPISSKIASLDWSRRSKDYGRPFRKPVIGDGFQAEAVRNASRVSNSSSGSSYAEAVKNFDIAIKESSEVVTWDEEAYDNSWLKFCAVGWAIGEPFLIEDETLHREKLFRGKILVLIPFGHRCPSVIKVATGKSNFTVSVWEDPVPATIEWISKRLGIGLDVYADSKGVGSGDLGDMQGFPRQDNSTVPGPKGGGAAALNHSSFQIPLEKESDARISSIGCHLDPLPLGLLVKPNSIKGVPKKVQFKGKGVLLKKATRFPSVSHNPNGNLVIDKCKAPGLIGMM
ncbi:hypothetical protein QYF36_013530 [Acer negundo]|nr:hypothetical protein QYF36_013530 [Acer negundo]